MNKSKTNKIHDAIINFYSEASDEVIKSELKDSIEDMQEYEAKKLKLEREISFLIRAQEQHQKNELLLAVAKRFQEELLKNTERPVAMLKQILGKNQALALNKNLKNLTKDEIVEIIKDKNLVELLERLNEE